VLGIAGVETPPLAVNYMARCMRQRERLCAKEAEFTATVLAISYGATGVVVIRHAWFQSRLRKS
jgi:hypothetical protein